MCYVKASCVVLGVVALAFGLSQAAFATVVVQNGDFEATTTPATSSSNTLVYTKDFQPSGMNADGVPRWTFGPSVSANGAWDGIRTSNDPNWSMPTFGSQAAFIEGMGTISQDISDLALGTLSVSFYATVPAGTAVTSYAPLVVEPIQVKLDSTILTFGLSNDTTVSPEAGVMTPYTSNVISVTAGSHTLSFLGTDNSGVWGGAYEVSGIDNVSIGGTSTIPEPSTLVLLAAGLISLLAYAWRKRK